MPRAIGVRQEDQEIKGHFRIIILITRMHSLSDRHKYLAPSRENGSFTFHARCVFTIPVCAPSHVQLFPGAAFIFHDSKITQMLSRYDSSRFTCNFTSLPFKRLRENTKKWN